MDYTINYINPETGEVEDVDHACTLQEAKNKIIGENAVVENENDEVVSISGSCPGWNISNKMTIGMTRRIYTYPASTNSFVYNDGGREKAGYKGYTGDCVTRAVAIATQQDYKTVYEAMTKVNKKTRITKTTSRGFSNGNGSPRNGVYTNRKPFKDYMESLGWKWVACTGIGMGTKTHLRKEELPMGRIICRVSKHLVAVIDGVIHDTSDCSRNGTRCVYGYWMKG